MSEMTESDARILNEGRLLRAEADLMIPMLAERREAAVARLLQHYRAGELDKLTAVTAEICVTEDLKQSIKNKIKRAEQVERKFT